MYVCVGQINLLNEVAQFSQYVSNGQTFTCQWLIKTD